MSYLLGIIQLQQKKIKDTTSIDIFLEVIKNHLDTYVNNEIRIRDIIQLYIEKIPDKICNYIANYILKNYSIKQKFYNRRTNNAGVANKYISSTYLSFERNFRDILDIISKTYGNSYLSITNPQIQNHNIELNITNDEKSRQIIHSLSKKIKELLINKRVTLTDSTEQNIYSINLEDDYMYINFIFRNILYAIRNNTVHGNIASRLNSRTRNKNSYASSVYLYILGYMFLTLSLYELNYLNIEDLEINITNIKEFDNF